MGVVTTKSTAITNRDATPRVLNNASLVGSELKSVGAVASIASGDSSTSIYPLFSLPSNAVVRSLKVSSPDIGTTTVGNFGLYDTTAAGGAVVDADFFKASVSLKDGAIAKSEIVNGNVITLARMEKAIWELLAIADTTILVDPAKMYDVALTLTGDADAAGVIFVECEYVLK